MGILVCCCLEGGVGEDGARVQFSLVAPFAQISENWFAEFGCGYTAGVAAKARVPISGIANLHN